ncbi:heparin lyase I family protein [Paraburkholderia sabiae]|uniref:Heparin lyase I family protein n=1 Tax=Paraburkholderia sabiae TaxID=273251 RepID=A0ABU9QS24_9BURK|nr:heparin lyase I family protein [Paraburkholderia sabiae]
MKSNEPGYRVVMRIDWRDGIPRSAGVQTATGQATTIVKTNPSAEPRLRIQINRSDPFGRVANGVPRAELSLGATKIVNGSEYLLDWSTTLSDDFSFDYSQPEIVTQILQGGRTLGAPPVALVINGDHYELRVHSDVPHSMRAYKFGSIQNDRGRTVCWRLHYIPGTVGEKSTTELYKDGQQVVSEYDQGNAYSGDNDASIKVGIYKWLWLAQRSDVRSLTIEYGNVTLSRKDPVPAGAAGSSIGGRL